MKRIGIFYGSTTGTTEEVAGRIAKKLKVSAGDVKSAADLSESAVADYDLLLLGTSTWGNGELQDDWYDALERLKRADLSGKMVALFGCGDSDGYEDSFCDGIGLLYLELKSTGATFIGSVSTDGYQFASSAALIEGKLVGLALDEMNESDLTDDRIEHWVSALLAALN
jgi:flavodoxin I